MKSGTARWITARDLARGSREVLDGVERTGTPVMILRHGHPAAMLLPVGEAARKARVREVLSGVPRDAYADLLGVNVDPPAGEKPAAPADDVVHRDVLKAANLTEDEEAVVRAADETLQGPDAIARSAGGMSPKPLTLALSRLEMKKLLHRDRSGYVLTPKGAAVRVALAQRDRVRERDGPG